MRGQFRTGQSPREAPIAGEKGAGGGRISSERCTHAARRQSNSRHRPEGKAGNGSPFGSRRIRIESPVRHDPDLPAASTTSSGMAGRLNPQERSCSASHPARGKRSSRFHPPCSRHSQLRSAHRTRASLEQPLHAESHTGASRAETGWSENGRRLHEERRVSRSPDARDIKMTLLHKTGAAGGRVHLEVGGVLNSGHVPGQSEANAGLAWSPSGKSGALRPFSGSCVRRLGNRHGKLRPIWTTPSTPPLPSGHRGACSTASRCRGASRRRHWYRSDDGSFDYVRSGALGRDGGKNAGNRRSPQLASKGDVSNRGRPVWKLGCNDCGTGCAGTQSVLLALLDRRQPPACVRLSPIRATKEADQRAMQQCLSPFAGWPWETSCLSERWPAWRLRTNRYHV